MAPPFENPTATANVLRHSLLNRPFTGSQIETATCVADGVCKVIVPSVFFTATGTGRGQFFGLVIIFSGHTNVGSSGYFASPTLLTGSPAPVILQNQHSPGSKSDTSQDLTRRHFLISSFFCAKSKSHIHCAFGQFLE